MTPIWLTLLVAVIAVVGPWLAYRASLRSTNAIRLNAIEADSTANRALEQAAETARQSNETARQANALAASKSNREAIMQAIMMLEREKPEVVERGWAILEAIARMEGLSTDDARLIDALLAPRHAAVEAEMRELQSSAGMDGQPYVDADEHGDDDDAEEV
jgi:hypothetical protein